MSEIALMKRLWFMDWAGYLLSYDPLENCITRLLFTPHFTPDFFALTSLPLSLPTAITLRQRAGIPNDFPDIEMQKTENGRIAFKALHNGCWLTSDLFGSKAAFQAEKLLEWEQFIPLTFENLESLSILGDPQSADIEDAYERLTPPLKFFEDGTAGIGGFRFSLPENLNFLLPLRTIARHTPYHLTLYGLDRKKECFEVTKKMEA